MNDRRPRVLAIIPAKAHSSRCPGKNTRVLGGQPLVRWTVQSALAVEAPKLDVWVSTDEGPAGDEVERLAREPGVTVIRRPSELCQDPAQAPDVAIHALEEYRQRAGEPDAVVMLLPTSPFRAASQIEMALAMHFYNKDRANVVSVTEADAFLSHKLCSVAVGYIRNGPPLRDEVLRNDLARIRQDGGLTYSSVLLNGAIWVTTPERLLRERHVSAIGALPLVMDEESSLDIDSDLQWGAAESIVARRYGAVRPVMRCVP